MSTDVDHDDDDDEDDGDEDDDDNNDDKSSDDEDVVDDDNNDRNNENEEGDIRNYEEEDETDYANLLEINQNGSTEVAQIISNIKREKLRTFRDFVTDYLITSKEGRQTKNVTQSQTIELSTVFKLVNCEQYKEAVKILLETETLSDIQLLTAYRLAMKIQESTMKNEHGNVEQNEREKKLAANIENEEELSISKLRYVGGYVIAKLKYRSGKRLDSKLGGGRMKDTKREITIYNVFKKVAGNINCKIQNPTTMIEIHHKMYGNLTILTDECLEFFIALEKARLELLTESGLARRGSMLPGYAMEQLLADTKLSELWDAATKSKQTSHINKTILPSAFCVTFFFCTIEII